MFSVSKGKTKRFLRSGHHGINHRQVVCEVVGDIRSNHRGACHVNVFQPIDQSAKIIDIKDCGGSITARVDIEGSYRASRIREIHAGPTTVNVVFTRTGAAGVNRVLPGSPSDHIFDYAFREAKSSVLVQGEAKR